MISLNHLGYLGRLGNQMFQYAALMGIAKKYDYDFIIPPPTGDKTLTGQFKVDHLLLEAFALPNLKCVGWSRFDKTVVEDTLKRPFDKNMFDTCPDNVDIKGFFQSEKYFEHIKENIIKEFQFNPELEWACQTEIQKLGNDIICLHVRRTDYIPENNTIPHPMLACSLEYYIEALKHFDDRRRVIIFSDDIDWCVNTFKGERFIFSKDRSNIVDMCLMTYCNDYIISNSSFSWWGAYLSKNKNKKVIAPKKWFSFGNRDDMNIVPDGWIRL